MTPEFATAYRDMMCDDMARESATTRRVIDAVPAEGNDYRPDPTSKSGFELAWHVANSGVQLLEGIADLKFTMNDRYPCPATPAEIGEWYAATFAATLDRVRALTAEQLLTPVNFYGVFNLPAFVYLSFVQKHEVHHRGQLSAYLRAMGSKVPGIYGGSADEPFDASASAAGAE